MNLSCTISLEDHDIIFLGIHTVPDVQCWCILNVGELIVGQCFEGIEDIVLVDNVDNDNFEVITMNRVKSKIQIIIYTVELRSRIEKTDTVYIDVRHHYKTDSCYWNGLM